MSDRPKKNFFEDMWENKIKEAKLYPLCVKYIAQRSLPMMKWFKETGFTTLCRDLDSDIAKFNNSSINENKLDGTRDKLIAQIDKYITWLDKDYIKQFEFEDGSEIDTPLNRRLLDNNLKLVPKLKIHIKAFRNLVDSTVDAMIDDNEANLKVHNLTWNFDLFNSGAKQLLNQTGIVNYDENSKIKISQALVVKGDNALDEQKIANLVKKEAEKIQKAVSDQIENLSKILKKLELENKQIQELEDATIAALEIDKVEKNIQFMLPKYEVDVAKRVNAQIKEYNDTTDEIEVLIAREVAVDTSLDTFALAASATINLMSGDVIGVLYTVYKSVTTIAKIGSRLKSFFGDAGDNFESLKEHKLIIERNIIQNISSIASKLKDGVNQSDYSKIISAFTEMGKAAGGQLRSFDKKNRLFLKSVLSLDKLLKMATNQIGPLAAAVTALENKIDTMGDDEFELILKNYVKELKKKSTQFLQDVESAKESLDEYENNVGENIDWYKEANKWYKGNKVNKAKTYDECSKAVINYGSTVKTVIWDIATSTDFAVSGLVSPLFSLAQEVADSLHSETNEYITKRLKAKKEIDDSNRN